VLPQCLNGCTSVVRNFHNKDWRPDGVALTSRRLQFFSMSCLIKDSVRTVVAVFLYLSAKKILLLVEICLASGRYCYVFLTDALEHMILLEL
jgi:hypothetical protein